MRRRWHAHAGCELPPHRCVRHRCAANCCWKASLCFPCPRLSAGSCWLKMNCSPLGGLRFESLVLSKTGTPHGVAEGADGLVLPLPSPFGGSARGLRRLTTNEGGTGTLERAFRLRSSCITARIFGAHFENAACQTTKEGGTGTSDRAFSIRSSSLTACMTPKLERLFSPGIQGPVTQIRKAYLKGQHLPWCNDGVAPQYLQKSKGVRAL
jgi:hypothetical protein